MQNLQNKINDLNIGIVGLGHLGKMHLNNIKELARERKDIQSIFVFDTDSKKYELLQDTGVIFCHSLDELIRKVNAALVVTPTITHYDIARELIANKVNTFIEKPLCDTIEKAYKLSTLAADTKLVVQVGHIERFNPALLSVEPFLGTPMFIESHRLSMFNPRSTDISVIEDLMIHDLDIILSLVKSKVKSIDANGVPIMTGKVDIANARIKFENGCVANITASRISQKKMRKMRIFQNNAYITVDFEKNTSEVFLLDKETTDPTNVITSLVKNNVRMYVKHIKPVVPELNAMKFEQNNFLDSIVNNKSPLISIDDGIRALEVAQMVLKQIEPFET
ncbi:MAG: Gfo/Idh/MocA family protein [Ignavibacteria bacterium]